MFFKPRSATITPKIKKQLTEMRNAMVVYPQEKAVLVATNSGPYDGRELYAVTRLYAIINFMVDTYKVERDRFIMSVEEAGDADAVLYRIIRVQQGEAAPVCVPPLPPGYYKRD